MIKLCLEEEGTSSCSVGGCWSPLPLGPMYSTHSLMYYTGPPVLYQGMKHFGLFQIMRIFCPRIIAARLESMAAWPDGGTPRAIGAVCSRHCGASANIRMVNLQGMRSGEIFAGQVFRAEIELRRRTSKDFYFPPLSSMRR